MPSVAGNEGGFVADLAIHSIDNFFNKHNKGLRAGVIGVNRDAAVMGRALADFSGDGARLSPQESVFPS